MLLYAKANKAIYGTMKAALLFWKKLKTELVNSYGFIANPYDPCTVNKIIKGTQATIVWHLDDLKISHVNKEVVDDILNDLNDAFGKQTGLSTTTGKVHDYLGMTIDYSRENMVMITMFDYLQDILANIPDTLKTNKGCPTPAAAHLFQVNDKAEKLNKQDADIFHRTVARLLFAAKRARPDIQTAIAFLCTRVKSPDVDDWKKLMRVLGYIRDTIFLPLTLGWDETGNVYWYVDASFAVHDNMRSHTGAIMTLGKGAAMSMSTKQKLNTKSSTEAELVGVSDYLPHCIWFGHFLHHQGYNIDENIIFQDNTSAIKMERNGRNSCTGNSRHIDVRYFFIKDRVEKGEISIKYCPTNLMLADYYTKALQGKLFNIYRNVIMGYDDISVILDHLDAVSEERVGNSGAKTRKMSPILKNKKINFRSNDGRTKISNANDVSNKKVRFNLVQDTDKDISRYDSSTSSNKSGKKRKSNDSVRTYRDVLIHGK